jgi:demethylmenaquinone methyltransferase/2-methoxy-6-polyprenyl-1,4-benzoquinol methylase
MPDDVLAEQIAYYRARAPEYDEWFERRGMFDLGPEWNAIWEAEVSAVAAAVPDGEHVLELACGTGWWTQRLVRSARSVTAIDASPEVLSLNRARVGDDRVRYVRADLFSWEPDGRYDVVFFAFWLSHVPHDRFDAFWEIVAHALAPGGRVFFVDNQRRPVPGRENFRRFIQSDTSEDGVVVRRLKDGREFRAVKIYYEPSGLEARLASLGWRAEVRETDWFFYYGTAMRDG